MRILAIETSCDETAVCLIEAEGGADKSFRFQVLGNALLSQAAAHAQYGGVFPNLAKREHAKNLVPLLEAALREARLLGEQYSDISLCRGTLEGIFAREPELLEQLVPFLAAHGKPRIDAITVTVGPGLEPALWVGINFARALALAWELPIVAVNHMEGHIVMPLVDVDGYASILQHTGMRGGMRAFEMPVLALLISGGHTELVLMREWMRYERLGQTRDDAAGEAFDKTARLLGLPYPGGPEISRLAETARAEGIEPTKLTPPMLKSRDYDFSFSGLKTEVRRLVERNSPLSGAMRQSIAAGIENAIAEVLVEKTTRAAEEYGAHAVAVGGGVAANSFIRRRLGDALAKAGCPLLAPPPALATDNALMIALAGYFHAMRGEFSDGARLVADGSLRLA